MRSACEAAAGSPPEGVLRALQVGERISAESVHQVVRRATEGVQRTHGPPLARRQKRRGHAPSANAQSRQARMVLSSGPECGTAQAQHWSLQAPA